MSGAGELHRYYKSNVPSGPATRYLAGAWKCARCGSAVAGVRYQTEPRDHWIVVLGNGLGM